METETEAKLSFRAKRNPMPRSPLDSSVAAPGMTALHLLLPFPPWLWTSRFHHVIHPHGFLGEKRLSVPGTNQGPVVAFWVSMRE